MAFLDVRKENKKVISFHKKIGAIYEREDEYNVYFTYTRTEYLMMRKRYNRYIDTIHVCYMI